MTTKRSDAVIKNSFSVAQSHNHLYNFISSISNKPNMINESVSTHEKRSNQ